MAYIIMLFVDFVLFSLVVSFPPRNAAFRPFWRILLALLLALPFLPYAVVEAQTALFKSQILSATKQGLDSVALSTDIRQLKILTISPTRATVYTVTPCLEKSAERGVAIQLERVSGAWHYVPGTDDCIWSDSGSAQGSVFPPY
ncbi:MAG TPA: hypothetical protein VGL77_18425 [Armatimonadota bacterium]